MKYLVYVFAAKIILTVAAWCVPLLLLPSSLLASLGFPIPEPQVFLRLLGMAYTALVAAYVFGFRSAREGHYPVAVVWVGLISNGGAFLILLAAAALGTWSAWGFYARLFMWASLVGTGAITGGLLVFGPCRRMVQSRRVREQSKAA